VSRIWRICGEEIGKSGQGFGAFAVMKIGGSASPFWKIYGPVLENA
jgi:hypothetical protein